MKYYAISREQHEDGNFHIHSYIMCDPVLKTRKMDYFDIVSELGNFHPNI